MAIGSPQWMYKSGEAAFTIDQSLRLDRASSSYLSRTPSSAGNRRTFTFSTWLKRGNYDTAGSQHSLFYATGYDEINIYQTSSATDFRVKHAAGDYNLTTNQSFRDSSAWMHLLVAFDSTQGTASNRIKIYINGTQVTSFATENYPSQNYDFVFNNSGQLHTIATNAGDLDYEFDGYLAETHFIDGTALTPTSFGETGDYGEWKPIEVSGLTYGTNGFYLDFADSGALGDDESGNTNDWTANNLTAADQVLDSPTNNFATLNPLEGARSETGTRTFSEGNLQVVTPVSELGINFATMGVTSGKWYAEFLIKASSSSLQRAVIGVTGDRIATLDTNDNIGSLSGARDVSYMGNDGDKKVSNTESSYGSAFVNGDIIGVALDVDNNTVNFYHNGVAKGNITIASTGTWHIGCGDASGGVSATIVANFGQDSSFAGNKTAQGNTDSGGIGDFYYTPPSGFLALCTDNLPDVAVVPSEHFSTIAYSGNGSTQSITGAGFQPDEVWIKCRNAVANHRLFDVIRGTTKSLISNSTSAEVTLSNSLTSFDTDGFSCGSYDEVNGSGRTYIAWNWKANGSGSSNTNGSITSTVSANVDAGFSIVSYTGTGSAGTIGHGLSKQPELMLVKNRDKSWAWRVFVKDITTADGQVLTLNLSNAKETLGGGSTAWDVSEMSSSVIGIGSYGDTNNSGDDFIAYCFHSVDGYSKVGSYTGNNNNDGTFVYTGFKPAFVLIKNTGSAGWHIKTAEIQNNEITKYLYADTSGAENDTANHGIDFLSNGFKLRTTAGYAETNGDGNTIVYMAFAETPFKYSNGR